MKRNNTKTKPKQVKLTKEKEIKIDELGQPFDPRKCDSFMCTINFKEDQENYMDYLPDFTVIPGIKRVTIQLEKASLIHWQMFVELDYKVEAYTLHNNFMKHCKISVHCQGKQKGDNVFAGRQYCQKGKPYKGFRAIWTLKNGYEKLTGYINPFLHDDELERPWKKYEDLINWENGPTDANIRNQLRANIARDNHYLRQEIVVQNNNERVQAIPPLVII